MADFAEEEEPWLRGFLVLPNGIPSHDTLKLCVDGKAVCGNRDGVNSAVHWVSALAG